MRAEMTSCLVSGFESAWPASPSVIMVFSWLMTASPRPKNFASSYTPSGLTSLSRMSWSYLRIKSLSPGFLFDHFFGNRPTYVTYLNHTIILSENFCDLADARTLDANERYGSGFKKTLEKTALRAQMEPCISGVLYWRHGPRPLKPAAPQHPIINYRFEKKILRFYQQYKTHFGYLFLNYC